MRFSPAAKAGTAVTWLVVAVATAAGCSTTVDGMASCPGCGNGTEPTFPTSKPTVAPTETLEPSPEAPADDNTLAPSASGYVYIETVSGKTRCQISSNTVGCESEFTDSPTIGGEQANGVEVSASGGNRWIVGNLGAMPTTTINYATYHAVGWTIEANTDGTTFTSDDTGHGMSVSIDAVDFF